MRAKEVMENTPNGKVKKGILAYVISDTDRSRLAHQFPPKFSEFIGHHITYQLGWPVDQLAPEFSSFDIVGYACDDTGIEALVVEVDGSTARPDGKTYHITWSLDRSAGFSPRMSNDLVAKGWQAIANPINIHASAKII